METKRLGVLVLLVGLLIAAGLFTACSGDDDEGGGNGDLNREGESCTKTSDCENNLRCVDQKCVQDEESSDGDDSGADGDNTGTDGDIAGGDEPVDGEICEVTNNCASKQCYNGDVWCYDNCGELDHKDEDCGSDSCSGGECSGCQVTNNCASKQCYNGDVWCYDNCGELDYKDEDCGSDSCSGGECSGCQVTNNCASKQCYNGDVWCYDNCGELDHKDEDCGSDSCSGGECSGCQVTNNCASKQCYNGDVWCYDNCGELDHKDEDCGSDRCSSDSCQSSGEPWYDSASGLTWQNPPADNLVDWQDAIDYCNDLNLDGHSDWRLPSISELRSLIRGCPGTVTGGACGVTDSCTDDSCYDNAACNYCDANGFGNGPADGCYWPDSMEGSCQSYWSSSPSYDNYVWFVFFYSAHVGGTSSRVGNSDCYVRCVRDAP